MNALRTWFIPGISGVLFGLGLVLAGMTRPGKVVGFLDVGHWDPSLAFVMIGAMAVQGLAWRWVPGMPSPWTGGRFAIPTRRDIDAKLVVGAAVFGVGWGIGGYCPGPGLASLGTGTADVLVFLGAMLAGMQLHQAVDRTVLDVQAPTPP